MSIRFPNVPIGEGVPPVLRSQLAPVDAAITRLTGDSAAVENAKTGEWGIYDDSGTQILQADSISGVDVVAEARSATYPITGGGFESFNKVSAPFIVRMDMIKSGTKLEKMAFLELLESLRNGTEIVSVVVPERTYFDVTLSRYEVVRNSDTGPQAMQVAVSFDEIRVQAQIEFSDGKTPNAVDTASNGSVQGAPTSAATATPQ